VLTKCTLTGPDQIGASVRSIFSADSVWRRHDVAVEVERDPNTGVPKQLLNYFGMIALREPQ
jgi:hypothetical protein